eukprot:TRINITY_DN9956_c0_g1_i1.p1 TRINITY_DN9956_c0_g1~~TRINITY_DN9956_c0_g1_i1.p1  ORF type:complete len:277 (+),score=51.74 TRINITY_DN9956_c0_g1_i1:132-962(+)
MGGADRPAGGTRPSTSYESRRRPNTASTIRPKTSMSIRSTYGNTTNPPSRAPTASSRPTSSRSLTRPKKDYPAPSALQKQVADKQVQASKARKGSATKRSKDGMKLVFHCDDNCSLRVKTCRWQAAFVTEPTIAPSEFRHRDFADEKELTQFDRYFHVDNSLAIQIKTARSQGDLRDTVPEKPKAKSNNSMELVFRPLDAQESIGDRVKAPTGVHRDRVDPREARLQDRKLKNNWGDLWKHVEDPKPQFTKYFRTTRPSDKLTDMGMQRGGYFLPD